MKNIKKSFVFIILSLFSGVCSHAQLIHPGGWFLQDDLTLIRTKVAAGEEPWVTGWNAIKDEEAGVNYKATVSTLITDNSALSRQGYATYVLAIKWVASGDQRYADAAIGVINEWVETVEDFDVYGPTLTLSTAGGYMAQAAEILAHSFNGEAGWPSSEVSAAQVWFKERVYDAWTNTGDQRSQNWGTSCVGGNMSMAVFCDNQTMLDQQISAYKFGYQDTDDGCASVTQYIWSETGQAFESGRDQAHVQGGIAHLVEAALCAWNQGVDIVSYADYRLVAGVEYHAKYNAGYDDLPWDPNVEDHNYCNQRILGDANMISPEARGFVSPMYGLCDKLFTLAGQDHQFTDEIVAHPDYFPESTNNSHPGMGALCFVTSDLIISGCNNRTAKIEAECYDDMFGIKPENINTGGESMAFIENGDWAVYNNIDLTDVYSVQALASSQNMGGTIEVRLDAVEGELLGTINVSNTGNWQAFLSTSTNIGVVDGIHDVYIVFKGEDGYLFNLDWFGFSEEFICNNTTALIEAECYDDMSGIQTQGASEGTLNVGWVNNGDWASYENIDLTNMNSIKTRVSSKVSDGFIEVHLDAADGDLIAEIPVTNTGGNQNWVTDSMNIQAASGLHDVYLVFTGGDDFLFNINNFGFSEERIVVTGVENSLLDGLNIYPNPTKDNIHISGVTGSNIELYNHSGALEIRERVSNSDDHQLNLSGLDAGVYFIKVLSDDGFIVEKIIIE